MKPTVMNCIMKERRTQGNSFFPKIISIDELFEHVKKDKKKHLLDFFLFFLTFYYIDIKSLLSFSFIVCFMSYLIHKYQKLALSFFVMSIELTNR